MVIDRSVRIAPRTYRLPAPESLDSAVIVVRGSGITVDFGGATLVGMDPLADPDLARGVGVRIDGGSDVRIVNANVRGYHIGILARGTRGFHLSDSDLSYNWKPRLYSLVEHESLVDWLSFHDNEDDEWLRFGAGIFLDGVTGGEIAGTTVRQGMNGLLMNRTDSLTVRDNDFSFNSGLGIGMYRSDDNLIVRNRLDFNVRGYSHGFYHRGQDSAGILMYEQCSGNVVAYNSATHGGDGVFVWAGRSTMETGEGGVNDNLFFGNDFSFAPANSMEATFSRNTFVGNRAEGSDYGVWGGYSYESAFVGNCFFGNRIGIAIEHGQENLIASNLFAGDTTAVSVWARPSEPADWGYPQHRDTRSRDTRVEGNVFLDNRVGVRGVRTSGLEVAGNRLVGVDSTRVIDDGSSLEWAESNEILDALDAAGTRGGDAPEAPRAPETAGVPAEARWPDCAAVPPLPAEYAALAPQVEGGTELPSTSLARRDRAAIIVDEWGPYDWRSPKLWPVDSARAVPLRLAVVGPPGVWQVVDRTGIGALSQTSGSTRDTLLLTPEHGSFGDWELTLEFRGGETLSPRGVRRATYEPFRFSYGRFEPAIEWDARFFAWTPADPEGGPHEGVTAEAGPPDIEAVAATEPIHIARLSRLDYQWYRPRVEPLPDENWALVATGKVTLGPGEYTLRTISDDGIRVWVDGERVIDNWSPHGSEVDFAPIGRGRHDLRIEYYQAGGWTELRVEIVRGTAASPGSPGPH
jgi:parallel beta-helix repeat protein